MRLSPATRLTDRQTVWVAYCNDGTPAPALVDHPASIWAAQFQDAFRNDVRQMQWG